MEKQINEIIVAHNYSLLDMAITIRRLGEKVKALERERE
jgi:hypothetical protein